MRFSIEVEERAVTSIRRLPREIHLHVVKSLSRLHNAPESEGKPSSGLYPKGHVLELEYAVGDLEFYIDVMYRIDETASEVAVFDVLWEYV